MTAIAVAAGIGLLGLLLGRFAFRMAKLVLLVGLLVGGWAVLRTYALELYRIPSGSMLPTLAIDDVISVDKTAYGLDLPFVGRMSTGDSPRRGDVVVFNAPGGKGTLVKRIVGLPGDTIEYKQRTLKVNGETVAYERGRAYVGAGPNAQMTGARRGVEHLPGRDHEILPGDGKQYSGQGKWTVPPGRYFVLGDNRDQSMDSRYWGFVDRKDILGRATRVVMNIDQGFGGDRLWRAVP